MKKNNLFRTALFAFFALIMVGFVSCSDDDIPVKPVNPQNEKGHDEWTKVTFTFHVGHLHGKTFHGNPVNDKVKYYKAEQEYSIEQNEKGELIHSTEPIRFVNGDDYALEIKYYNKDGELMNSEFATPENAPIHQHFFLTKDAKHLKSDKPFEKANNILSYTYRDTDPVDKNFRENGVKLRENDPLGFKGYFHVNENQVKFDLNVILVHIAKGNKFKADGSPYDFNAPYKGFLGTQDLNVRIPIRVYGDREDYEQLIDDIATEFGISREEAEADVNLQWSTPFESGNFWM